MAWDIWACECSQLTCQRHACTLFTVVQPRYKTDRTCPISYVPRASVGKDSTMRQYLVLVFIVLKDLFLLLLLCLCLCECPSHVYGNLWRPQEGAGSPAVGVTSRWEPPNIGVRNWTQPWSAGRAASSLSSFLSHLFIQHFGARVSLRSSG